MYKSLEIVLGNYLALFNIICIENFICILLLVIRWTQEMMKMLISI
jgi:hypothetical protein